MSNSSNIVRITLSTIFLMALPCFCAYVFFYEFRPSDTFFRNSHGSHLVPVIHLSSNAFFNWSFDPLISSLSGSSAYLGSFMSMLCIFSFGIALLTVGLRKDFSGLLFASSSAFVAGSVLFLLFGFDVVVFGSLLWVPWLLYTLHCAYQEKGDLKLPAMLVLLVLSLLLAFSAHQIAVILIAAAHFLTYRNDDSTPNKTIILFILTVLPAFVACLDVTLPQFPVYPTDAHLVPASGTVLSQAAMIGPDYPLPTLNRNYFRGSFFTLAGVLTIACASFMLLNARLKSASSYQIAMRCYYLSLFCFIGLIFDSALVSPDTNQIAPIQSLARLVPGLNLIPLSTLLMALSILLLFVASILLKRRAEILILVVICLLIPQLNKNQWGESPAKFPLFADNSLTQLALDKNLANNLVISPSYFANSTYYSASHFNDLNFSEIPIKDLDATVQASNHPELIAQLKDGDPSTRWSPSIGKQLGTEWLAIKFSAPVTFNGVILNTGNFFSDFPRGLSISSAEHCEDDSSSQLKNIVTLSNWEGAFNRTAEGLAYFGPQNRVNVIFPNSETISCLKINQTGITTNYDWSVAELGLLVSLN
jgi:hypothetical protein